METSRVEATGRAHPQFKTRYDGKRSVPVHFLHRNDLKIPLMKRIRSRYNEEIRIVDTVLTLDVLFSLYVGSLCNLTT